MSELKREAVENRERGFGNVSVFAKAFVAADLVGFAAGFDEGLRQAAEIVKTYNTDGYGNFIGPIQTIWEAIEDEVAP